MLVDSSLFWSLLVWFTQTAWIQWLPLTLHKYGILNGFHHLSVPQPCNCGESSSQVLTDMLWSLEEIMHAKCFERCQTYYGHNKCYLLFVGTSKIINSVPVNLSELSFLGLWKFYCYSTCKERYLSPEAKIFFRWVRKLYDFILRTAISVFLNFLLFYFLSIEMVISILCTALPKEIIWIL